MIGRIALPSVLLAALLTSAVAKPPVVVIDPGHPASPRDPGLRGKKVWEVQANYRIAAMLAAMLNQQGVNAMLTKTDVRMMLTNQRRADIANWAKAKLYIRLHCDGTTGSGFAIYYPAAPGTTPDGVKGPSKEVILASADVAKKFHAAMVAAMHGELADNGIKTDAQTPVGAKQGALTGSIYSKSPTILIDMLVLSNPHDEAWIMNRKNPAKLAKALDAGVLAALGMTPQ